MYLYKFATTHTLFLLAVLIDAFVSFLMALIAAVPIIVGLLAKSSEPPPAEQAKDVEKGKKSANNGKKMADKEGDGTASKKDKKDTKNNKKKEKNKKAELEFESEFENPVQEE